MQVLDARDFERLRIGEAKDGDLLTRVSALLSQPLTVPRIGRPPLVLKLVQAELGENPIVEEVAVEVDVTEHGSGGEIGQSPSVRITYLFTDGSDLTDAMRGFARWIASEYDYLVRDVVSPAVPERGERARVDQDPIRKETKSHTAVTLAAGEALVGEGNEVAHIDLLLGSKSGPVGKAFARAFVNESEGHTNLLAVITPNLPAKPDTVITTKVTISGAKQAVQLFGPAQAAVSRAVVDSVAEGVIPRDQVDDLVIIVGVFIHWEAEDDKKIYDWNYQAVKTSIARALAGEPTTDYLLAETPARRHPFAGGAEG
jgi:5,6,7,8-tetrahydromethanopterin hydro-lyase